MELDEKSILKDMGRRLAIRRDDLGLTQENLAEQTGLNPKHISLIERGLKQIQISTLIKICTALQFDYTYAITGNATTYKSEELQELWGKLDSEGFNIMWGLLHKLAED